MGWFLRIEVARCLSRLTAHLHQQSYKWSPKRRKATLSCDIPLPFGDVIHLILTEGFSQLFCWVNHEKYSVKMQCLLLAVHAFSRLLLQQVG